MIVVRSYFFLVVLVFLIGGQAEAQVSNFLFGGYMRSGFGLDGKSKPMDVFKAPNSEGKYRLGNEAEAYVETMFGYKTSDENKVDFETFVRFAFVTPTSKSNAFTTTMTVREAYVRMSGFLPRQRSMTFWGGQRFYDRYDNYLIDFWFRDMSGFGGGVEAIALGKTLKLSVAFLGGSIDDLQSNGNVYPEEYFVLNKTTLDLHLYEINWLGGKFSFTFDVSHFTGDTVVTNQGTFFLESDNGWSAGLFYFHPLRGDGMNTFNIFYGTGAAENYKATMVRPNGLIVNPGDLIRVNSMWRFRVLNDLRVNMSPHFSLMALTEYQRLDNGMVTSGLLNWFSLGFRPMYHFSRYFSLVAEISMDHTRQEGINRGTLAKFTVTPQLTPVNKFLSRPALRAFFTWAVWSDEFVGLVAPYSFPHTNKGLSFGIQMETWW